MPNLLIEEERYADKLAYNAKWRAKRMLDPAYRKKINDQQRANYAKHRTERALWQRRWRAENPERYARTQKKSRKKALARLPPNRLLTNLNSRLLLSGEARLKMADVPKELLEAERAKILLGRRLRAKRKKLNQEES